MKKLLLTTSVLTLAIAGAAVANTQTATQQQPNTPATNGQLAAQSTPNQQQLAGSEPAAGKKPVHKHIHRHHHGKPVAAATAESPAYTEMRVGDPRIVYHEIGTSGAQNGNTIVPFHDEPIRSSKPYEIRYDYAEFRDDAR